MKEGYCERSTLAMATQSGLGKPVSDHGLASARRQRIIHTDLSDFVAGRCAGTAINGWKLPFHSAQFKLISSNIVMIILIIMT